MNGKSAWSLKIVLVLVVLSVAACDSGQGTIDDPFVGTWSLSAETVGGTTLAIGPDATEVSATVVVNKDNTMTTSARWQGTDISSTGTWSRNGSSYTTVGTATVNGNTHTATVTGSLSSDYKTWTASGNDVDSAGNTTPVEATYVRQ